MLLCQPSNYVRSEALLAVNRERVNLRHADNRYYKLIGRMLVCFDVSPELPNNSPKLTIRFLISEPPIEEVYLEVLFSSVADSHQGAHAAKGLRQTGKCIIAAYH